MDNVVFSSVSPRGHRGSCYLAHGTNQGQQYIHTAPSRQLFLYPQNFHSINALGAPSSIHLPTYWLLFF